MTARLTGPDGRTFDAVVALGSNVGDKTGNIARATAALTSDGQVTLVAASQNYRTAPWGNTDQDWFVNACMTVTTTLDPHGLLARCLDVERQLGRVRAVKWGPRIIDLDVLIYRDAVIDTVDLVLPHPHMTSRAFVLRPLADIAPGLNIGGHTVAEWLTRIPHDDVVAI
ncbi:MAG: 2-amino-4-hydroxy-6-hydroxymethyldihydropteridine diphosphokinase [Hyphomicrobium aestuarii]|nr:2-amino-4-hydroxy-6-hydroxymethyldihydropteridine diphosphokinase [Hyphomicrobium aestuarii]